MTSYDTAVSNGTCYWKAGSKAGRSFISCGNSYAAGVDFQCCSVGDVCFDNGACYNNYYGATYLAACTDPDYKAPECPDKGVYSDRQWSGLVTCGTSTGQFKMDETWAGCPEPDLDRLTNFTKGCECNDTNPALFTDYHDLVRTALLPQSSGGILTFVNGHDASTILVTATSVLTITGTVDSITPSSISPGTVGPSASPADAIGLTTGTKVGIGAGVAGTALLFGIIAVLAWILRKRSRGNNHGPDPKQSPPPNSESYSDPTSPSVIDSQMSTPGLSGFKAELAADGPPSGGALVSPMTPGSPQFQCRPRQFEAYNPDLHGNYSHYRNRSDTVSPLRDTVYGSVFSVSPQHTGSTQDHTMAGTERTGQHPMEPIVELQG